MYSFNVEKETNNCVKWIQDWFDKNGKGCNAIIGLSGGKDSTVVAALCAKALGAERVIGVAMPDVGQSINEADEIAKYLGITFMICPIDEITRKFNFIGEEHKYIDISSQAEQNIPPRIRMTVLYALAQTYNGRVSCNCNLSEDYLGYSTLWGDSVGSFAPLSNLTVTEIRQMGHYLGIPEKWVDKIPDDGLPHSCSDEHKFGFTYEELDRKIRGLDTADISTEKEEKMLLMYEKSKFKRNIINIDKFKPNVYSAEFVKNSINI